MGILKTLVVSHKRESNGNYVILLQKTPVSNQPSLIFEAGTIVNLATDEAEQVRRTGGFAKILEGYACLGMLQYAYEGSKEILFLIIVTGCVSIGKIQNSEIFCITDVVLLSMRNGPGDQELISGVKRLLSSGCFYFSNPTMANQAPYDLTLAVQRAHMLNRQTDNRFFWNRLLHRHFERYGVCTTTWLVKVLCGGINITTVYIGGLQAKACLISRLSCERAGTRFNVRGVNDLGHVANFVETEQVIFLNQIVLSFIIIRGSIPLFWEQPGVQVGSHRIKMSRGSEISQAAYDKHMFLLRERYENTVIINLLSSRESELTLNQLFNSHHKTSQIGSEFPFINFDFHALCARGHRENLEKLFTYELNQYCEQYGFFHAERGNVIQLQQGVLRVNCLDCLDRTNSMQAYIGLKMLSKIVRCMERVDVDKVLPRLHDVYENLWVQNGDQISRIYTGTGALEGKSMLKDGTLSVARTIQNNLLDASKQGAIDILILGRLLNRDYSYRAASLLPHYFLYASPSILVEMCDRYLSYCSNEKLRVVVGTWNVNGGRHFDNTVYNRARPVSDWLVDYRTSVEMGTGEGDLLNNSTSEPPDIYAIGFQEIVDLNASNIVASSTQNQRDWLIEIQKTISRQCRYLLVTSVQLVGVCLFVFIRKELSPYIRDVCNDMVKTGLGGATGNKGGVAIRLRYKATSMCFVCAHFAAGQHQVKERNEDYAEITRRIQFPMGRSINSHDYVFWCGDFNYRLEKIANEDARRLAMSREFNVLLEHDQLKISQAQNLTFKGYMEGDINFAPSYKYDMFSNDYDTSEKCRVPAYTDRILFKKRHETREGEDLEDPSQIKFYNRVELLSSDHRPIIAEFEIEALDVDKEARNEVLNQVLEDCGPPDSTVFVCVDGHLEVADNQVFAAILKILADEAGEIVLVRYVKATLMIIFSDGKAAIKALELNGCPLGDHLPDNKLIITLRTNNWHQVTRAELMNNMDNTMNLVSGAGPSVHLEDDEDEAAQELNMSLGPEINPDSICLTNDLFVTQTDSTKSVAGNSEQILIEQSGGKQQPPPVPPKSPLHPPSRPPPPPPHTLTKAPSPQPPPLPVTPNRTRAKQLACFADLAATNQPEDAFGFPVASGQYDSLAHGEETISDFGDTTFDDKSSINLVDLSISSEFDAGGLPPPTMAPPQLPPMTPSRLPPDLPKQPPHGLTKPSRAAPPPPIPSRLNELEASTATDDAELESVQI